MAVTVGDQIQAVVGDWTNPPTSYTYQWQDSPDGVGTWANISGETRSDYIILVGETGKWFRCRIVATNAGGSSSTVNSAVVGPAGTPPLLPVNTSAPFASGTITPGQTLTCTTGTWANTPTSYTYQWQTSANDSTWTNVPAATGSSLMIVMGQTDQYRRCQVTAANGSGSVTATSNEVVAPSAPPPGPNFLYQPIPVLISGTQQSTGLGPDPSMTGY